MCGSQVLDMSASAPPFAIAVAVAPGVFLVTQNGINTALKEASGMPAVVTAFFSFSVSTIAIISAAFIHKPACDFSLAGAPWYAYCGGLLGSGYVFGAVCVSQRFKPPRRLPSSLQEHLLFEAHVVMCMCMYMCACAL